MKTGLDWWTQYDNYLQSPRWKLTRAVRLCLSGHRCALWWRGGCSGPLQCHHKRYTHVGHEFPFHLFDLQVLCKSHHKDVTK